VAAIADAGHSRPLIDKLTALEAEVARPAAEFETLDQGAAPPSAVTAELVDFGVKVFFDRDLAGDETRRAALAPLRMPLQVHNKPHNIATSLFGKLLMLLA
jgi:hypothetical protein